MNLKHRFQEVRGTLLDLRLVFGGSAIFLALAALSANGLAADAPAGVPLLSGASSATPNLMIAVDNSVISSNPFSLD